MGLKGMSQRNKDRSSCRSGEISSVLIEMSQKYKDRPYCRSGEISSGVDMNVSEVQRQSIL